MSAAEKLPETSEFFAPANTDMVDGLVGRYNEKRQCIERACEFIDGSDFSKALYYFEKGTNTDGRHRTVSPSFKLDVGVAALNAEFWREALELTDVLDFMPANRREEWFELIRKMETPEFDESTVRATLRDLLAARMDFLAEKVDGIFRALSRTHVTNQPEGFSKRMILTGVTDDWGSYSRSQTGHINDLRQVIAKFMARDEPDWAASNRLVEIARQDHRGEWLNVDGGALRIRCYKNGNAHLEVHPDIAWRLNEILAHLYPAAIPSRFRTKPAKKQREYTLMERPLPFAVLEVLHRLGRAYDTAENSRRLIPNGVRIETHDKDKHVIAEVEQVLELLGGVKQSRGGYHWFQFDYCPDQVIREIVCTGCIPDQKSHQYYPTPEHIARDAVDLAELKIDTATLEPSAGTGNLADIIAQYAPVQCVEVSGLHCNVLNEKGHAVHKVDFLKWGTEHRFPRIVMNPPYSQGRWLAHLKHAVSMLRHDGILVAILPASAKGKEFFNGYAHTYSKVYENQFRGASVDVVILKLEQEGGEA